MVLERDLAGVDPDREGAQGELNNALDRLTNTSADEDQPATAGEFRAVLTTSLGDGGAQVSAGPVEDVPTDAARDGRRRARSRTSTRPLSPSRASRSRR